MLKLKIVGLFMILLAFSCSKENVQPESLSTYNQSIEIDNSSEDLLNKKNITLSCNKFGPFATLHFTGSSINSCYYIYVFKNMPGSPSVGTWVKENGVADALVGYSGTATAGCGWSYSKGCSLLDASTSYKYKLSTTFYPAGTSGSTISGSYSLFTTLDCSCFSDPQP